MVILCTIFMVEIPHLLQPMASWHLEAPVKESELYFVPDGSSFVPGFERQI